MSSPHSDIARSTRIYRCLLWLYPPGFRLRFGAEMLNVFEDCCRARERRARNHAEFWVSVLRDFANFLPGEWRDALIRSGSVELAIRQWFETLVIPFAILAYLAAEGKLVAAAIHKPTALPWAHGCADASLLSCVQSNGLDGTYLAITLVLALIGVLISMIIARYNHAAIWTVKLYSPRYTNYEACT